jgi:hypothetical protein
VSWQTLAGVVEWWADEGLRDLGRQRFHQGRGRSTKSELLPPGTIVVGRAVFIASRTPWRMAQIRTGTTRPDDTAVVAWADDSTAVLKGNPAEQVLVESNDS